MLACPANTEARGSGSRPVPPRDFRDAAKIGTVKNKFECEKKKRGNATGEPAISSAPRVNSRESTRGVVVPSSRMPPPLPLVSSATFVWLPLLRYLLGIIADRSSPLSLLHSSFVTSPVTLLLHVIPSRTAPTVYFRAAPMYRVSLL